MAIELHEEWGHRLRRARKNRGLSLHEVSEQAGISKTYYCYLEAGHRYDPSTDVRMRLAAALGCRVEDIWVYPEPDQAAS